LASRDARGRRERRSVKTIAREPRADADADETVRFKRINGSDRIDSIQFDYKK